MQNTKYQRLKDDFQAALTDDNLEECFKLLRKGFNLSAEHQKDLILMERIYNQARRERRTNKMGFEKFSEETSKTADSLLQVMSSLTEDDISLSDEIPNRIVVVICKNSPTDWDTMFSEAFFSHAHIMRYGEEVPAAYISPDVVIFDDLECPGIGNESKMRMLAREMPGAHLLYFGLPGENPFKKKDASEEDKTFAARCADANSKFTVHARLRELLEFRKIYRPKRSTDGLISRELNG